MSLPVVAIVGRPNVGKSTLFNRIVGGSAIVDDQPGVTRDRHAATGTWNGRTFSVVDTGGLVPESDQGMDAQINAQIRAAIDEADVCVLVVDAHTGIASTDRDAATLLRESGKSTVLAVNKVDGERHRELVWEFYELGLGDPQPVAALSGTRSGDLLDAIVAALPPRSGPEAEDPDEVSIAVLGKPNVGKSSFLNRILGEERFIVSPVAGTTRDAIDTSIRYDRRRIRLVDTAGIRRHAALESGLEYYTYLRAVRSLDRVGVAIVILDASEPLSRQDMRILNLVEERGRGIVVAVNKWDLIEKDERTEAGYRRQFAEQASSLAHAPLITMSALTGMRARQALEKAISVWDEWHRRVPTPALNRVLREATARTQPPQSKGYRPGRVVRLLYGHQVDTRPPLFVLYSNDPKAIPEHYRRYLEHRFRDAFGFAGVPLRIRFRKATPRSRSRVGAATEEEAP